MPINPIAPNVSQYTSAVSATSVKSAAVDMPKTEEKALQPGDQLSIGEQQPSKKPKFLQWLSDVFKPQVEGPTETYQEKTFRILDGILSQAEPGDIPQDLPLSNDNKANAQPIDNFMVGSDEPGLGAFGEKLPQKSDVAGYKDISPKTAAKNYRAEVEPNLSKVQKGIIKAYCGRAFMAMNGYLLGGNEDNETGTVKKAVSCATGALNKFEVPAGTVLHRTADIGELHSYVPDEDFPKYQKFSQRGKTEKLAEILDARLQGTQNQRKTFLSTSITNNFQLISKPKVETKFYVGEGVKGVFVAPDPELTNYSNEMEYLLAPDTKATVMGVDYNPDVDGLVMHVFLGDMPDQPIH